MLIPTLINKISITPPNYLQLLNYLKFGIGISEKGLLAHDLIREKL